MILQCILVFQRFSRHYLLYSEWLACDLSHRRSHELATGPAHTSLFSHGWLPVAPHKLPITSASLRSPPHRSLPFLAHCYALFPSRRQRVSITNIAGMYTILEVIVLLQI